MKEIEANKQAWRVLSEEHYQTFRKRLREPDFRLNAHIRRELGEIAGKKLIHLQCNTGADSILLARMGAQVTGVDLVPDNIRCARRLAAELDMEDLRFLQSDVLRLGEVHQETYYIVFTSEGAIGWLPDLDAWVRTVRRLLRPEGWFYLFDSHPFYMMLDENKLAQNRMEVGYPYFSGEPTVENTIGGYAAQVHQGVTAYFWTHTVGDILNALGGAGLHLEWLHEYPENFWDAGNMEADPATGLYRYPFNNGLFPMTLSLKATVQR